MDFHPTLASVRLTQAELDALPKCLDVTDPEKPFRSSMAIGDELKTIVVRYIKGWQHIYVAEIVESEA